MLDLYGKDMLLKKYYLMVCSVEGRKNDEMEITSKKCKTSNSTETSIAIASLDQYADIVNSFFNHTSMITIMILPIAGILRIKLAF